MPDLLTHYVISYLIASRLFRPKYALIIAVAGLLPDVDALFRLHRWFTHSIVITAVVVIAITLITYTAHRKLLAPILTVSTLYLLHIIMDLFTAPTPILWPVISKQYMINAGLNGIISTNEVGMKPYTKITVSEVDFIPKTSIDGPIISTTGIIISLGAIALILAENIKRKQ